MKKIDIKSKSESEKVMFLLQMENRKQAYRLLMTALVVGSILGAAVTLLLQFLVKLIF